MEELQSALKGNGLTLSNLPEKGRCLLTTRDFHLGEVIISQEPYVCVPNKSPVESRCDGCFTTSNLKKSSGCHVVWYCGSTCQKLGWKLHRLECEALSRLDRDKRKCVTPSIRLMVIPTTATDNYNLVEALVSRMPDIDEKQLVLYARMANLVNFILQQPDINIKEIAENFSKVFKINSYPAKYFWHCSCLPNSVLVFEGRLAVIRAVQHVPQGAESDDIQESVVLEGYRCKDEGCNGFLLRSSDDKGFICQQRGRVRDKEETRKIASEVKSMSEKALMSLSSGNQLEAVSMHQTIEKLQRKLCHPFPISLMQTREKILMELQNWREALAYCKLTIPVYQRVYPGFHPLLGLQYYTYGKLERFLGDTEDAIKSVTKAMDILRITHGTNTPFMRDLLMKLEEAHAKASHKLSCKDE
ncbi:histone-lysine n-methyltransferase ashr1 [Quercus suber]|uniref:Histone-lysine n-methyltransferase ashr1 n=1 Tax=Quercus suber TaxID=58331 RepID=A0AAW0IU56_QUESU